MVQGSRSSSTSAGARPVAVVSWLLCILLLASCGEPDRPTVGEWLPTWSAALETVPPPEAFADGPDEDLCETTLGELREFGADILPAPDAALDPAVRGWIETAEDLFFECPPNDGDVRGFPAAYAELDRFRSEVEAGLTGD